MDLIINILITVCIIVYFLIYIRGILKGTAKPVLATWLFFSVATAISFFANYHITGSKGIAANFFNLIDSVSVITIFFFILFRKDTRKTFDRFEKYCIGAVIGILIVWLLSGKDFMTHVAVQLILVVAYLPSLYKLWKSRDDSEPLGTWLFDFFASVLSIIIPIRNLDTLPIIYGIRSTISTLLMTILILRNKKMKTKKLSI